MGLYDSLRKTFLGNGRLKRSIYLQEDGRPRTIITTSREPQKGITPTERSESTLKKFWTYYEGEGTIFAAINTTAWNSVMVGYNIVSDDENARLLIQSYLDRLNIDLILLDNVIYTLVYGDSFIELIKNSKGDIVKLKTVDPTTIVINYDRYGIVTGYQQKIQGQLQSTILKPEDIMHIKFFSRPTSPYGISLIQPSQATLDRKIRTDEALFNAILRHGTSKYLVKVGSAEEFPPESVFVDIKNELEDITEINEIIVPGLIDITPLDSKGIAGVEEYATTFQTQLIIGLLCPEEALGLGRGSTEATSTVKQMMYEKMIRAFQLRMADQIREELINFILVKNGFKEDIVKLRFNSVADSDEAIKAKWLGNLLRGYAEGEERPFTANEIRAMFGYGPKEKEQTNQPTTTEQPSKPEQIINPIEPQGSTPEVKPVESQPVGPSPKEERAHVKKRKKNYKRNYEKEE